MSYHEVYFFRFTHVDQTDGSFKRAAVRVESIESVSDSCKGIRLVTKTGQAFELTSDYTHDKVISILELSLVY